MKKLFYFLILSVILIACSNDEIGRQNEDSKLDLSQITGEWVLPNSSGDYYTDILFTSNYKVELSLVQRAIGERSVCERDEGTWFYTEGETPLIYFTMLNKQFSNQKITEIGEHYIKLHDLKYNVTDTYYRVVETKDLAFGINDTIRYLQEHRDFIVNEFASSNTDVVRVSSEGVIEPQQCGTAFISMSTEHETLYVKVNVSSRIDVYADETHLTIDEIQTIHGIPDGTAKHINRYNNNLDAIIYHESIADQHLDYIQYCYDRNTRKISTIETIYKTAQSFKSDSLYLSEYFSLVNSSLYISYGESPYLHENTYVITPLLLAHDMYICYTNNDYNAYGGIIEWNLTSGIDKTLHKELYMEPYLINGASVSDVKEYMNDYTLAVDIQAGPNIYWMGYKGYDYEGNDINYQYNFSSIDSGLCSAFVTIKSYFITLEDIDSHLLANGYTSFGKINNRNAYYSSNALVYVYYNSNTGYPIIEYQIM